MEGGKKNKFTLKLAPGDNGSSLHRCYFTNPYEFVPAKEDVQSLGRLGWGIPSDERAGSIQFLMQQMMTGNMYLGEIPKPQEQFARVLRERWMEELKQYRASEEYQTRLKQDMTLMVEMKDPDTPPTTKLLYRKVVVSGGLTLRILADKVLIPVIGFVRNYHSWLYRSLCYAGAWSTPEDSKAIDSMHAGLGHFGFAPIDDSQLVVADFWRQIGDAAEFVYDLGDTFRFRIVLEEMASPEESTGRVRLVGGAMAAPPENSSGLVDKRYYETVAKRKWKDAEVLKASNYKDSKLKKWDPHVFDVDAANKRLADAIASQGSTLEGKRAFITFDGSDPRSSFQEEKELQ